MAWDDLPGREPDRPADGAPNQLDAESRLLEARQRLDREAHSAFAASQVLRCMREVGKARGKPLTFVREARSLRERFPADPWVVGNFAWLCYDACKARLQRGELDAAAALLEELVGLFPAMADDRSAIFFEQVARLFGEAVKSGKQRSGKHRQLFVRLTGVGRSLYDTALPILPTQRTLNAEGKELPSACERFLLRLRTAAEEAGEWEFLRGLCLEVVNGRWPVADPKWFGKSLLDALCHLPTDEAVTEATNRFLAIHGDDEHLQLARAKWLDAQGRKIDAEEAFTIAVAIARSPWSWRELAIFLGWKGAFEAARNALRAALSWLDRSNPGFTWQIHFELARLSLKLGDSEEGAIEAHLGRWSRQVAGWSPDPKLEQFVQAQHSQLDGRMREVADTPGEGLLRQRFPVYRDAREVFLDQLAVPCVVCRADPGRGLAWVRPAGGGEQDALLRVRPNRDRLPESGTNIRAIVVPSWDRKKERPGLRVAWWRLAK